MTITGGTSRTVEVAVIGAGIVGAVAAWHLARAGRRVLVLDKEGPWREASGVNAGTLALQNKPPALIGLYREGLAAWDHLVLELGDDVGRVAAGGLRIAISEADVVRLRSSAEEIAAEGVALEWLEGSALRRRAPWLAPSVAAATFCPEDGFASPLLAGRALLRGLERAGAGVLHNTVVLGQTRDGAGYRLQTTAGPISADTVVIAAGAWADRVAAMFGVDLPVRASVNMLAVTERMPPFTGGMIMTHVAGGLTFKQFGNGTCILGGGAKGRGDPRSGRKELHHGRLVAHLGRHATTVPGLRQARLVRAWAGLLGVPADDVPVVGRLAGHDGLFVGLATGAGFTLGPIVGRLLAEAVMGEEPSLAAGLDPARITAPAVALAGGPERPGMLSGSH